MRGEHILPDTSHALSGGSSPHARGALDADQRRRVHAGIIPAYAGSTSIGAARGRATGIIPACAGSTD